MSESIETTSTSGNRKPGEFPPAPIAALLNQASSAAELPLGQSADYDQALAENPRWALSEGSRHFEGKSAVFEALHRIAKRLTELQIPYAVVGGMALFHHGVRRFTEYVDLLVTKQDLKRIHEELARRGYRPPHRYSKHLRDTVAGVRIEFLTAGDYPGDGRQKPVAFPDPTEVSSLADGIRYIHLPTLVELKLASGMTNPGRLKDLSDVLELIKLLNLPADFAEQLDPYVRGKYAELWKQAKKRYITLWRNKGLTSDASSLDEMIQALGAAAPELEAMRADGVTLDLEAGGITDDCAYLMTTDPDVARKYQMLEESEFWGDAAADGIQGDGIQDKRDEADDVPKLA